jgi:hypothetical protein
MRDVRIKFPSTHFQAGTAVHPVTTSGARHLESVSIRWWIPRLYDWRTSVTTGMGTDAMGAAGEQRPGRKAKSNSQGKQRGAISKTRRRLDAKPPRWHYDFDAKVAACVKLGRDCGGGLS